MGPQIRKDVILKWKLSIETATSFSLVFFLIHIIIASGLLAFTFALF